jgi:hypothetical protein
MMLHSVLAARVAPANGSVERGTPPIGLEHAAAAAAAAAELYSNIQGLICLLAIHIVGGASDNCCVSLKLSANCLQATSDEQHASDGA